MRYRGGSPGWADGGRARLAALALAALALAALAGGLVATPASPASAATLKPDLVVRPFTEIELCHEAPGVIFKADACTGDGHIVLRFTNQIGNRGAGPLELAPNEAAEPNDCHGNGDPGGHDDDVLVNERLFIDLNHDGRFDPGEDTKFRNRPAGCRYFHPEHNHYHLGGYAVYSLRSERTGALVATSQKASFCISDTAPFDLSLPGAPSEVHYTIADCEQRDSISGTSIGWFDSYRWNLFGQSLDVTSLTRGKYCLISRADPQRHLVEERTDNDTRKARILIDPAAAPAPVPGQHSQLELSPLGGRCRLGGSG